MKQVKVTISENQIEFLNMHHFYGFKDKSSLVRKAIEQFKKNLENQKLKESGDLYAEIYREDSETQDLTDSALSDWPK